MSKEKVLMGFIPKDARWYLADIVLEHRVEGESLNVVHINTHLIEASSPEEAYSKALRLGQEGEMEYQNTDDQLVQVLFRGLRELNVIHEELEDGAELMYSERLGVSEEQLQEWNRPKEKLAVFRPIPESRKHPNYMPERFKFFLEEFDSGPENPEDSH
jgi:hypothetical protein